MEKVIACCLLVTLGLSLMLTGCDRPVTTPLPPTSAPTTPAPKPVTISAAELFATNCASCHGQDRQGIFSLGPALTPERLGNRSDTEIRDIILNSRPDTLMPAWGNTLSSAEIDALLQFIKYTPVTKTSRPTNTQYLMITLVTTIHK